MSLPAEFFRRILAVVILFSLGSTLLTLQSVSAQDDSQVTDEPASETINLELILDASGSMAEEIEPGVTRIDAAREVLQSIIAQLPQREGVNIGVRVFGHKGANNESGRAESCLSTELLVPLADVETSAMQGVIDAYEPVGWTPTTLALQSSELDFPDASENQVNAVLLMTDGLETCGGDPCSIAAQLHNGPKAITTNVVGFALAPDDEEALQCVADEGGGALIGAATAAELNEAMTIMLSGLNILQTTGVIEIESVGGIYPEATIIGGPAPSSLQPDPEVTTETFADGNVLEVPAGTYQVSWETTSGSIISLEVLVSPGETALIRGSLIQLPMSPITPYRVIALDGSVVWESTVSFGDVLWVLPGTYRIEAIGADASTIILAMVIQTLPGTITEVSASTM
ncbi:MAG: hypothetical protein AB7V46_24080 [Thermomicrobiales bacterium]